MSADLVVVYLLPASGPPTRGDRRWRRLGADPVRDFARAYATHDAGADHRVLVVRNGSTGEDRIVELLSEFPHELLELPRPVSDLDAYRLAAAHVTAEVLCFLNAGATPKARGWLRRLRDAVEGEGVGLAGATASYESVMPRLPHLWRRWPPFPNPHVRSNAFVLHSHDLRSLRWPPASRKLGAMRIESGTSSLTRQMLRMGRRTVVAGSDGGVFDVDEWFDSRTFRSGDQANLLVADNRTRQFEEASPEERQRLTALAWGADPHASAAIVRSRFPA